MALLGRALSFAAGRSVSDFYHISEDVVNVAAGMAEPKVLRREWTTREGWRDTKAGMWAWLIQRAAAVLLLVVIALHLVNPFRREVQAALLALALLHALLGVRSLLLDFGLPVRWHRALFAGALALAVLLFALVWTWRWY